MRLKNVSVAVVLAAALVVPSVAGADSIRILTGVDASNSVISQNALDPFWTISVQGGAFGAARAAAPGHTIICCIMETVGPQALWISDASITPDSPWTGWGGGPPPIEGPIAIARRTFDLTGFDVSSVSLSGIWRVADVRYGVFVNGNLVGGGFTDDRGFGWGSDQPFSLGAGSGLFLAGLNTLELRGASVNSGFDGFWLDATIDGRRTGAAPIPEPATISLLGLGLAAAARARLRRRE